MSRPDRERWDARYAAKSVPKVVTPDTWLVQQVNSRPPGRALELACGVGHNAIWLAEQGWRVDAIDVSPTGLALAEQLSKHVLSPPVTWMAVDLDECALPEETYDLVVVFRFLERMRLPNLIRGTLRPGGLLVYETFSHAQMTRTDNHLRNADFTLMPGELPTLFPTLTVVDYEEVDLSDRSVARMAAFK